MSDAPAPEAIQLVNQDGTAKSFAPDDVAKAVASGAWGAPVGTPIPIVHNGDVSTVPIEQLTAAVQKGASVVSHDTLQKAQLQAQYGGIGDQIENAATQALSGASLGTSDMLIGALASKETRAGIRGRAEANPIGTTVAKVAGALAPIIATGGAAAPEEAGALGLAEGAEATGLGSRLLGGARSVVTAPQNLLTKVGNVAEGAVGSLLPEEATSLAGKLAIKAAQTAARGTAEGAAIGGSDYLGETALSDDQKFDGEKLLAAVGHGALLGGVGGAGLGVAGELGSSVLNKLGGSLARQAEDSAASAILEGRTAKAAMKMDALPGGKAGVGRVLIDDGLIQAGDSVTEIAPRIAAAREAAGAKIGDLRRSLDEAGVEGPSLEGLHEALDKGVLAKLREMPGLNAGAINKIESLKEDVAHLAGGGERAVAEHTFEDAKAFLKTPEGQAALGRALQHNGIETTEALAKGKIPQAIKDAMPGGAATVPRLTFDQVAKIRGRLDDAIDFTRDPFGKVDATGDALLKARGALEDELTRAADEGATKLGRPEWRDQYEAAKLKYRQLSVADEAAQKAAISKMKNRKLSLTDYMTGSAIGAGHMAAGGPLGAITGLASAMAHKAIRERGSSTLAVTLDKLTAMGALQRATGRVDARLAQGVKGAIGGKAPAYDRISRELRGGPEAHGLDTFKEKSEAVTAAMANLPAHEASLRETVAGIAPHAPDTANAFVESALRATQYLNSVMPRSMPSNPLMPHVAPIEPSYHEQAVFSRVFDAVHDPLSTLKDMRDGTLVPEQPAAVKATAPKMKANIDATLMAAMAAATKPMGYPQAIATSMWLGQPTDPTLAPDSIASLQANFESGPKGPPGAPPHKGTPKASKMKLADQTSLEPGGLP
jgi:hypothetical protein